MGRLGERTPTDPIPREVHTYALQLLKEYGGIEALAKYADFTREFHGKPHKDSGTEDGGARPRIVPMQQRTLKGKR